MSKTAMVFFTLLLVLACCFSAGCSSLPFSGTPAPTETPKEVNVGLGGQVNAGSSQRFVFDEALGEIFSPDSFAKWNDTPVNIAEENASRENVYPEKNIKYIRGSDLDENGDATSWTFIVEHGDQFSIVTYNRLGMIVANSPGTIKQSEIFPDHIITPRKLFEKNQAVIFNTTRSGGAAVSRDLSLDGGNYTITTSGHGTPRILVFDAITGVLISSND